MKNKIKISILSSIFIFLVCFNIQAQQVKVKIGHINSNELLQLMPGREEAQQELMDYATTLEKQLQMMSKEFETKYQDYLANETKMTELVKKSKQRELTDLQTRISEFQESAQEELQIKEAQLVEPLLKKAQDAIHEVAKEKGYTYVLDVSAGSVLYYEDADDITVIVKKKLGIE